MGEVGSLLSTIDVNVAGELLREIIFPGQVICCDEKSMIQPSVSWSEDKIRDFVNTHFDHLDGNESIIERCCAFSVMKFGLIIGVFWFWDGDCYLHFIVKDINDEIARELHNNDCERKYDWKEEGS